MNVIDWLTSIDDKLEVTNSLLEKLLAKEWAIKPEFRVTVTIPENVVYRAIRDAFKELVLKDVIRRGVEEAMIDNDYAVFKIDLSEERTNEAIIKGAFVGRSLKVLKTDAPFTIRINSISKDPLTAYTGLAVDNVEIKEVYITNEPVSGEAEIMITWRT